MELNSLWLPGIQVNLFRIALCFDLIERQIQVCKKWQLVYNWIVHVFVIFLFQSLLLHENLALVHFCMFQKWMESRNSVHRKMLSLTDIRKRISYFHSEIFKSYYYKILLLCLFKRLGIFWLLIYPCMHFIVLFGRWMSVPLIEVRLIFYGNQSGGVLRTHNRCQELNNHIIISSWALSFCR